MSSVATFRITFDRPDAVYMAGGVVTGTIILDTTKDKNIRGFYFTAKGEANVQWTENKLQRYPDGTLYCVPIEYKAREKYFSIRGEILKPRKPNSRICLPAGHHQYKFQFQLPSNIPSSFEHLHGNVTYTMNAIIDRPWRSNHKCKVAFTVVSVFNLNKHRNKCLGIHEEIYKNFFCCCFSQGSMDIIIHVPSSGYVPGQRIKALVDYTNASSDIDITRIGLKLEHVLKLHSTSKTKTKRYENTTSWITGPFTAPGVTNVELDVPPIPSSHLTFCNIIDLDYYLKFIVHFSGISTTLYTKCTKCTPKETATSSAMPMPETPQPNTSTDNTQSHHLGFVIPGQANSSTSRDIPPPSYKARTPGAQNIRDDDESVHVQGANAPFRPKYPVFNYPAPSAPSQ